MGLRREPIASLFSHLQARRDVAHRDVNSVWYGLPDGHPLVLEVGYGLEAGQTRWEDWCELWTISEDVPTRHQMLCQLGTRPLVHRHVALREGNRDGRLDGGVTDRARIWRNVRSWAIGLHRCCARNVSVGLFIFRTLWPVTLTSASPSVPCGQHPDPSEAFARQ